MGKSLKSKIHSSVRRQLMRFARAKYKEMTGRNPTAPGTTVKVLVAGISGKNLTAPLCWKWLSENIGTFKPPKRAKLLGPDFYSTSAWRACRFEALKNANGCCVLCGRSNRVHGVVLHVDHIRPKSKYPELALRVDNCQILCEDCNMGKSNRDETDWRVSNDAELDRVDWRNY